MDYKGNLWSAILALIVGIVMVFFSDLALETVVLVIGILFIATGVFNLIIEMNRKDEKGRKRISPIGVLATAGTGILGILMVCTPHTMINLIIYLFAAAFILLGVYQICSLAFFYRPVTFPFWFFILPALLVITGVVICIIGPSAVAQTMTLITGIALIVDAIASFIDIAGLLAFRRDMRKMAEASQSAAQADTTPREVEDVEATEAAALRPVDK
ncbi:MAG: DUF308 domain-containing protein [Muribaculaceae bacterium]|nr:DUF308 domain-containing protein [Muribaculaceae bacterium]